MGENILDPPLRPSVTSPARGADATALIRRNMNQTSARITAPQEGEGNVTLVNWESFSSFRTLPGKY